MSAYRTAIDQTSRIIEHRARYFRNQIVIVVAIGALVVVAAIVTQSASVLWAWLLLVPACGLFFHADNKLLNEWRSELLKPWIACELDFAAFRKAILANSVLPKGTTDGMLMTLPSAGDLVAEQKVLTPTRRAIAAASLAMHRGKANALLLKVVASGIVVAALLAALWMRAFTPLFALLTLGLWPLLHWRGGRRHLRQCEVEVTQCRTQLGFSEADYVRIRTDLK